MKNNIYKLCILLLVVIVTSCQEEFRGQYPIDNISPKPVFNVTVENLPGAVKIDYEIPDETDILYVKAEYELSGGNHVFQKSSIFNNSMLIKGFSKSKKSTLLLYTVDRSQNVSEPVRVDIEPLDSPIYDIRNSLTVIESFGGVRVNWDNPLREEIMVGVLTKDSITGQFENRENFYSSEMMANRSVRGMDSTLITIGVFVRDIYMNFTDTLVLDVRPIFEEEIPKSNFSPLPLPSFVRLFNNNSTLQKIWDGNIFDETNYNYLYINPGNPMMPFFTFDMKVTAKFSRSKFWPRLRYAYTLHSPKIWEWWGTNDEVVARNNEDLNWESNPAWTKLMRCESKRPSGLDEGAPLTSEDTEYIEAGEEFEFPIEAPAVRYVRFKLISSWSGSDGVNLQEVQFWGQIQNN